MDTDTWLHLDKLINEGSELELVWRVYQRADESYYLSQETPETPERYIRDLTGEDLLHYLSQI